MGNYRAVTNQLDLIELCAPWDSPLSQSVLDCGGTAERLGLLNLVVSKSWSSYVDIVRGTFTFLPHVILGPSLTMRTKGLLNRLKTWLRNRNMVAAF